MVWLRACWFLSIRLLWLRGRPTNGKLFGRSLLSRRRAKEIGLFAAASVSLWSRFGFAVMQRRWHLCSLLLLWMVILVAIQIAIWITTLIATLVATLVAVHYFGCCSSALVTIAANAIASYSTLQACADSLHGCSRRCTGSLCTLCASTLHRMQASGIMPGI